MGDKLTEIADRADMIINGYAFTKEENVVRVLHLDPPHNAAVLSEDGSVIETNMDDIELALIGTYKGNYLDMYRKWASKSDKGFYGE